MLNKFSAVCKFAGRRKKLMLIHFCNQNPFTLIFRYYYYSVEELGGREGGGSGGGTKPGPKPGKKPGKKPSAARFAHPLRGAEVLVAVRGPSPGEGGGKKYSFERTVA